MLVRIVKMHFNPAFSQHFCQLFSEVHLLIKNFDGCQDVQLLKDEKDSAVFFTISHWQSAQHLENYRNSDLFKNTWAKVKPHFKHKAEAWSLAQIEQKP